MRRRVPAGDELGRCAFGLVLADRAAAAVTLTYGIVCRALIRGDVLDARARVRVPVDAADRRQAPFAAADVHLQVRHRPGIRLVIAELDHAAQDLAVIAAGGSGSAHMSRPPTRACPARR